ncbi:hypothetical protein KGF54_000271 [Candida jiufengensis]|uniref:uncharacterized protein n=1 Tax=Candida jiufengensis TaxID=497108 RepID=UPI002224BD77|nr:uncharacterized protein KGF54_000271 [Candida jiufengensis]KAI5957343.1 hypothetical protein KGF54_000271 [Candida jiufengensis]
MIFCSSKVGNSLQPIEHVFIIYLRGWDKFINQDIPFLKNTVSGIYNLSSNLQGDDKLNFLNLINLGNLGSFLNNVKSTHQEPESFDQSMDDSQAYLNYIRSKFGDDSSNNEYSSNNVDYEKLVGEGLNYLKDNVNINDVANNLQDILNRFQ